ncbi:hypothetical protein M431DRAFT_540980, partial [Trichoderma harzianum CBS 226.95]
PFTRSSAFLFSLHLLKSSKPSFVVGRISFSSPLVISCAESTGFSIASLSSVCFSLDKTSLSSVCFSLDKTSLSSVCSTFGIASLSSVCTSFDTTSLSSVCSPHTNNSLPASLFFRFIIFSP